MSEEMYKYYTGIQVSISGPEMKEIKPERYDYLEKLAYEDVLDERKARPEEFFLSKAEYKSYLLNLIDFACKVNIGITPILGSE